MSADRLISPLLHRDIYLPEAVVAAAAYGEKSGHRVTLLWETNGWRLALETGNSGETLHNCLLQEMMNAALRLSLERRLETMIS